MIFFETHDVAKAVWIRGARNEGKCCPLERSAQLDEPQDASNVSCIESDGGMIERKECEKVYSSLRYWDIDVRTWKYLRLQNERHGRCHEHVKNGQYHALQGAQSSNCIEGDGQ